MGVCLLCLGSVAAIEKVLAVCMQRSILQAPRPDREQAPQGLTRQAHRKVEAGAEVEGLHSRAVAQPAERLWQPVVRRDDVQRAEVRSTALQQVGHA